MKYILWGTPEFTAIILKKLIDAQIPPFAVVCNPDRPFGRKKILASPPVKKIAEKENIKIFQPENPKDIVSKLKTLGADLFIVASYSKILPKEVINIPFRGTIGVHPSLLPKYRGASPIQSVIIDGEKETGVSIYLLDEKMDHGPVLAQSKLPLAEPGYRQLANSNYENLSNKLAELSGNMLTEILPKFLAGEITPQPQNHNEATFTKKFTSEDGFVDPDKDDPILVERKIRALNPEPGVWMRRNDGKRVKLLEADIRDNVLHFTKIQVEGKKPMLL